MAQIEVIKPDSLITIQVSNYFYTRLQSLAIYLSKSVSEQELLNQIHNIKQFEPLSEFGEQYETALILLKELEDQARKQDLIELKYVDYSNIKS